MSKTKGSVTMNHVDVAIGARLVALRNKRNMTREELSRRSRIAESSLCQFESGHRRLDPMTMLAVTQALGVKVGDLYAVVLTRLTVRSSEAT